MPGGKNKNKDKKLRNCVMKQRSAANYPAVTPVKKQTSSKQGSKTGEKPILKTKHPVETEALKTIPINDRQMIRSERVIISWQ